jgi:hypothetical protein
MLEFDIPDLSFDGMLELVLGAIGGALEIPALMLPTIGLLDLAICLIALLILPILLLLEFMAPLIDLASPPISEGGLGMDIPAPPTKEELDEITGANLSDEEKKEKAEAVISKMAAKEAAEERAQRAAALRKEEEAHTKQRRKSGWKPKLGDDFYG